MATRIKVNVSDLLEAVKAKRAAAIEAHAERCVEYERDRTVGKRERKAATLDALKAATAAVRSGTALKSGTEWLGSDSRRTEVVYVPLTVSFPERVSKPADLNLTKFDRDIALLEMSAEDVITIGQNNDWMSYL